MKKKILFIIESMAGGAGRHVQDLILNLDKDKYIIYCIYSDNRIDEKFENNLSRLKEQATMICEPNLVREINIKRDFKAFFNITKSIKKINPDIIHCHSSKAGLLGRFSSKILGKKDVYYTPHAYSFLSKEFSSQKVKLFIFLEKIFSMYFTKKTFCVSKNEKEMAIKNNIDKQHKFEVIYNGIKSKIDFSTLGYNIDGNLKKTNIIVGNVARISDQKNPDLFIEIADKLSQIDKNIFFVWIGNGDLMPTIQMKLKKLNNPNILFLGEKSNAEFLVSEFDVFLITSKYEGLPYAPIEALRQNVPVIATDVVGNREIVLEDSFLINEKQVDYEKLLEKIYFLKNDTSNAYYNYFEKNFSLDTMLLKIEKNYLE